MCAHVCNMTLCGNTVHNLAFCPSLVCQPLSFIRPQEHVPAKDEKVNAEDFQQNSGSTSYVPLCDVPLSLQRDLNNNLR